MLNSLSNLAFGVAIINGITIAWWRKILHGSTIGELDRSLRFSGSVKDILFGVRYFNLIALAAIAAKLAIVDGILLQEAFSTEILSERVDGVPLRGYASEDIPVTGRVSLGTQVPSLLAKNFNDDLKIWIQGGGNLPNFYEGCDGLCYFKLPGAGFEVECDSPELTAIDYGRQARNAEALAQSGICSITTSTNGPVICQQALTGLTTEVFSLKFDPVYLDTDPFARIEMAIVSTNATYQDSTCPGTKRSQKCRLRPAVINYPVKVETHNGTHTLQSMSLGIDEPIDVPSTFLEYNTTLKQQNGFDVSRYITVNESFLTSINDTRTRLGGIALGLSTYLGGSANLSHSSTSGFSVDFADNAAVYLLNDLGTQEGKPQSRDDCGYQFVDPLQVQHFEPRFSAEGAYDVPGVVAKINQIMFALAVDVSNEDGLKDLIGGSKDVSAVMYRDAIFFKVNHRYMWAAFACTLFCMACVLPVYWDYWQLGRDFTLGAFEIAAAFRAPDFQHHRSSKSIEEIIQEIGDRKVQLDTHDNAGLVLAHNPV